MTKNVHESLVHTYIYISYIGESPDKSKGKFFYIVYAIIVFKIRSNAPVYYKGLGCFYIQKSYIMKRQNKFKIIDGIGTYLWEQ